jgi:hypothetical protein
MAHYKQFWKFSIAVVLRVQMLCLLAALGAAHNHARAYTMLVGGVHGQVKYFKFNNGNYLMISPKAKGSFLSGDEFYGESGSVVVLADGKGFVYTVAGPFYIFAGSEGLVVARGMVYVEAPKSLASSSGFAKILTTTLAVETTTNGVLWVDGRHSQWATTARSEVILPHSDGSRALEVARVYHPLQPETTVTVVPGYFSESSRSALYLGPRSARILDDKSKEQIQRVFSRAQFERSTKKTMAEKPRQSKQDQPMAKKSEKPVVQRQMASIAPEPQPQPEPYVGEADQIFLKKLEARLRGIEYKAPPKRPPGLTAEEKRRRAEAAVLARKKASREESLRAAMGGGAGVAGARMPASAMKGTGYQVKQGTLNGVIEDDFPEDRPSIIDRYIKE